MGQRPDELRPREIVVRVPAAGSAAHQRPPGLPEVEDDDQDNEITAARDDIELTRAEMTSTLDAIQDKLDPEVLSEQAKDTAHDVTDYAIREAKEAAREITDHALQQAREAVRDITGQARLAVREATIGKVEHMAHTATDTAGGWRQSLVETIKANPMPAALAGLGIGWMLLNRPESSRGRRFQASGETAYRGGGVPPAGVGYGGAYGLNLGQAAGRRSVGTEPQGPVGRVADQVQGGASQVLDQVQETGGQVVDRVQETGGQVVDRVQETGAQVVSQVQETGAQVVDQVQEQASNAQSFLQRQLNDNPLLVGAVAVAIGGALAGMVRSTPREDQLMGEARDRLVGSARDLSQDTIHKVERVVDEAQNAAKDSARQEALLPESKPAS